MKEKFTKFYDEYGYLHRYVVKDMLEAALNSFIRQR